MRCPGPRWIGTQKQKLSFAPGRLKSTELEGKSDVLRSTPVQGGEVRCAQQAESSLPARGFSVLTQRTDENTLVLAPGGTPWTGEFTHRPLLLGA